MYGTRMYGRSIEELGPISTGINWSSLVRYVYEAWEVRLRHSYLLIISLSHYTTTYQIPQHQSTLP